MLFSNKFAGRGDLLEGLSIWKEEKYRKLQGTIPVIFLSFAPVKTGNIEEMKIIIKQLIADKYDEYRDIMQSDLFSDKDRENYASVNRKIDDATAYMAINRLCIYLAKCCGRDVIVLLDEYDTPMQEAWLAGNWDETVDFFRNFFYHTFKTNARLHRKLIAGITRISKESIFSDLTTWMSSQQLLISMSHHLDLRRKKRKQYTLVLTNMEVMQIEEKQYEAQLIAEDFAPEHIRKYGFAFQGKTCLIG